MHTHSSNPAAQPRRGPRSGRPWPAAVVAAVVAAARRSHRQGQPWHRCGDICARRALRRPVVLLTSSALKQEEVMLALPVSEAAEAWSGRRRAGRGEEQDGRLAAIGRRRAPRYARSHESGSSRSKPVGERETSGSASTPSRACANDWRGRRSAWRGPCSPCVASGSPAARHPRERRGTAASVARLRTRGTRRAPTDTAPQ